MYSRIHIIHERSNILPINQKLSTITEKSFYKGEYSLKQNFFDPTKSSPPNDFLNKLRLRMTIYESDVKIEPNRNSE